MKWSFRLFLQYYIIFMTYGSVQAVPMVQTIINSSSFGYYILYHSDASPCGLRYQSSLIINHLSRFDHPFLLPHDDVDNSLILRPCYFYDKISGEKYELLDENYGYDMAKVKQAFEAWSLIYKHRKIKDAETWLKSWIGEDIVIAPNKLQIFGYIISVSRLAVYHTFHNHVDWLSYSKGVFSRLMVNIAIKQQRRKGIIPSLKVVAGEGGICKAGVIELLS